MPVPRIPDDNSDHAQVRGYVEEIPQPGYQHASAEAIEAFLDMKFGVRIHWGLYTLWQLQGESWPFLRMTRAKRQEYQQIYRQFNPQKFNAEGWMDLFHRAGLQCFAITTKHHEGFSMFDTQTRVKQRINYTAPGGPQIEACDLAYSVMETPFKRDIIKELCDAAHRSGIKIDFYFSHPDWYDADFRPYGFHPLQTRHVFTAPDEYGIPSYIRSMKNRRQHRLALEPTEEETERMVQRHRTQLIELLTKYGRIDMLCLDIWWGKRVWPQLRETIKILREIQPDVLLRGRGIGNYGDYYTPEGFVPSEKDDAVMPWMVIYPLGRTFSYDPDARHYKGAGWIIQNLVSCVAKGGNFMVGIGPDPQGAFHPAAVQELEETGKWLKTHGEGIYATRPFTPWHEGEDILFSRTKDRRCLYAFCTKEPAGDLLLRSAPHHPGMQVTLLGVETPLSWRQQGEAISVSLTEPVRAQRKQSDRYAWAFKLSYPEPIR